VAGFAPRLHGAFRPVGDTDSERVFCWLLQELAKAHAGVPGIAELTATLAELLPQPAAHGTFNLLLSNGQALWAYGAPHPARADAPRLWSIERRHPFGRARLADADLTADFAPLTTPADRVAVVATEPLTCDEVWSPFERGELRVFEGGALGARQLTTPAPPSMR
jgi:glutamine amidotransferase